MDKDKVKLIIRNLELLIDSLKAEIYSDNSPINKQESRFNFGEMDYDEVFDDSIND
jgi:hypothetical protein